MSRRFAFLAMLGYCFCPLALTFTAQQPVTGIPPLSSVSGGPFDTVDLANLNVHFSIPVFSRPGKGMPFSYNLSYDSLIWVPVASGSLTTWTPVSNWGWRSMTKLPSGMWAIRELSRNALALTASRSLTQTSLITMQREAYTRLTGLLWTPIAVLVMTSAPQKLPPTIPDTC